jgi:hypothetical protein
MERWLELRWAEVRRYGRAVLVSEDRARMRSHRMRDTGSQDRTMRYPAILASRQLQGNRYWRLAVNANGRWRPIGKTLSPCRATIGCVVLLVLQPRMCLQTPYSWFAQRDAYGISIMPSRLHTIIMHPALHSFHPTTLPATRCSHRQLKPQTLS